MISIIIPTFGNWPRLTKLINSLAKHEKHPFELIVVNDNPSVNFSAVVRASCKTVQNSENLGFAKSINRGLKEAKGDILLLVNDDIVWTSPVLSKIEKEFEDPELGVLGALLYYPKGARDRAPSIQHAGMTFDPKLKSFYHIKQNPKTKYMLAVTGAFFGISRKLYETIGGLDESFFLACEDTKYCIEAWNHDFKVKFSAGISATHEEGATRGKNPQEKRKFRDWTNKEAEGITRFKASIEPLHIQAIQKSIRKLNNEHLKIEVGSGYNPHPGFKHLDIRAGLPELDYVCDFIKDSLPFEDGSVEEILANHVIEHIPFRKLPFVLKEWARVLETGGKLTLRTPNLKFICETYLAGNLTPEWPGDEKFITDNLSDKMTPAWWANIKLFSGQDYAANFHHVCFDFEMLSQLLQRYGFGAVIQVKFDREFSPGELQVEAYRGGIKVYKQDEVLSHNQVKEQWAYLSNQISNGVKEVMKVQEHFREEVNKLVTLPKKSCLVIRNGAMGDVILTTPIIERLSKEYGVIDVCTKCTEVFTHNPHVKKVVPPGFVEDPSHYNYVLDLNNAYELRPNMHIVDAYSEVAFGDHETPLKTNLYHPRITDMDWIVIHAAKSWENRTWRIDAWYDVLRYLHQKKERVMLIGSGDDLSLELAQFAEVLVGKQSFWDMVYTISAAKLFIGMDSGPLHVAEAVKTPALGIYTCAKAVYRSTSPLTYHVLPEIDCYGCLHTEKPPVHYCGCKRGDFKCLDLITPTQVIKVYEQHFGTESEEGMTL